jgi:hypothetical protein
MNNDTHNIICSYYIVQMDKLNLSKKIISELNAKQIKNVPLDRKLHLKDMIRISKYINSSIFDDNDCCIWQGYVTNETNTKRSPYINFFYRNKKHALHRLLYENYVESLSDDHYLKFTCDENDGKCCNINHMIKYKYNNLPKVIKEENIKPVKQAKNKMKKQLSESDMRIVFE